jgi:hypothetical protein
VRQPDAGLFQPHRVVRVRGHGHPLQAALAQQRGEDPAVLVLVRAVAGDLRRQVLLRAGHERRDPAVLPSALSLATGGNRAEQLECLVVVEDFLEDRSGREHCDHLCRALPWTVRPVSASAVVMGSSLVYELSQAGSCRTG